MRDCILLGQRRIGLHIQSLIISVLLSKFDSLTSQHVPVGTPSGVTQEYEVMRELLEFIEKELFGVVSMDTALMKLIDHIVIHAQHNASTLTDQEMEGLLLGTYHRIAYSREGITSKVMQSKSTRRNPVEHKQDLRKLVTAQYQHDSVLSRYTILLDVLVSKEWIDRYDAVIASDHLSSQRRSSLTDYTTPTQWRTCLVMEMMAKHMIDLARPGSEDFIGRAIRVASHYHVVPYTLLNDVIGHFYHLKKYSYISDIVKVGGCGRLL